MKQLTIEVEMGILHLSFIYNNLTTIHCVVTLS